MVVAGACTRGNPDYDPETGVAEGGSDASESGPATGGDGATSIASADGASDSGPVPGCEMGELHPIEIGVARGMPGAGLEPVPATEADDGCSGELVVEGQFSLGLGGVLEWITCDDCTCQEGTLHRIDLQDSAAFPPGFAGCGRLHVFEGNTFGEGCSWEGLMVLPFDAGDPLFVATNSRELPYGGFQDAELVLRQACLDEAVCNGEVPGRYAIGFGEVSIGVGDPPTPADLGTGTQYLVTNYMSSIAPSCVERFAFTAAR